MSRSWRLAHLETPDFGQPRAWRITRAPQQRALTSIQRARRFLKLIREAKWQRLLATRAKFRDTATADAEWCFDRNLGSGTFGAVASWSLRDAAGAVVDEVAVKKLSKIASWDTNVDLACEAVVQKHMNLENCENVAHLRGYKAFVPAQEGIEKVRRCEYRFYQEIAPYGDLTTLFMRYRYWRTPLPEAFLWHLFDSLAAAAEATKRCPLTDLPQGFDYFREWKEQKEILNLDIKLENILLGYPDHRAHTTAMPAPSHGGTRKYNYPVIKMVDFGGCTITSQDDARNPVQFLPVGTYGCQPPEQTHYGCVWPQPGCGNADYHIQPARDMDGFGGETGQSLYIDGLTEVQQALTIGQARYNFKLLEKVHVWAIGKILFEAVVLDGHYTEEDMYWSASTFSYQEFQANQNHQLREFNVKPSGDHFRTVRQHYSHELVQLIQDCLVPRVADRIDVDELRKRTQAGMDEWDDEHFPGCEERDLDKSGNINTPKLYYRENEINLMPEGQLDVLANYNLYGEMQTFAPYNPDWVPLRAKWDEVKGESTFHEQWKAHYQNPRNFTDYQEKLRDTQFATHDGTSSDRVWICSRSSNAFSNINRGSLGSCFGRLHARDVDLKFNIARSRNAVRRLENAEAAQRARPPPPVANVGPGGGGGGGGGPGGPGGGGQGGPGGPWGPPPGNGGGHGGDGNSSAAKSTQNPPVNLQIPTIQAQFLGSTRAATSVQLPDFLRLPPQPSPAPPIPSAATIQSLINTGLAQPWVPNDANHPSRENNVYYAQASQLAAARLIPLLPPGIPSTDMNFTWDRAAQNYVYTYQGDMFWWSQADWKWYEVDRWPDTPANRALGRVGLPRIRGG